MISLAMNNPYNDQDNALHQVAKLVKKGIDAVDFSLMTLERVANGEPISNTASAQPIVPNISAF